MLAYAVAKCVGPHGVHRTCRAPRPHVRPSAANASRGASRTYEKLVADILKEAEETDQCEDGLFGANRGDELPEQLRTEEGRRQAFRLQRSGWRGRPAVAGRLRSRRLSLV